MLYYLLFFLRSTRADNNTSAPKPTVAVNPAPTDNNDKPSSEPSTPTKPINGETPVQPVAPGSNEKPKFETGEALVQPELPALNELPKAEKGEALVQPE